ncbi:MAG: EutN/CcmL family microcompartment protein [Nibricoccus sp.]
MRLGTVIGRITLTQKEPVYEGGRLLIVQPFSKAQFAGAPPVPLAKGSSLVVYDQLGAGQGSIVGITEGAEATQPFTGPAPVDAYVACIVERINYEPLPN